MQAQVAVDTGIVDCAKQTLVQRPDVILEKGGGGFEVGDVAYTPTMVDIDTFEVYRDRLDEALKEAEDNWTPNTADYLIGTPMLSDYLAEALDQLDWD